MRYTGSLARPVSFSLAPKRSTDIVVTKWIHLDESGGDPWVLPIWTSVNDAVRNSTVSPLAKDVYELGLHVSIRLNILPRVMTRVNEGTAHLFAAIKDHGHKYVFTLSHEGCALPVDNDLKYCLLADIDTLVFELNSVCELMTKLFEELHQHAGKPIKKGKTGIAIKRVIEDAGQDARWFQRLDLHRNFFIHEGAPYLAVDISHEPERYELLVTKENLRTFNDPEKFVTLSELATIVRGFTGAKYILQKCLKSLFQ